MGQSMAWTFVGGVGTLIATAWAARLLGRAMHGRSSLLFWAANAVILIAAVGLVVLSTTSMSGTAGDLAWGAALGLGFGGLAGLRNGWKRPAVPAQGPLRSRGVRRVPPPSA